MDEGKARQSRVDSKPLHVPRWMRTSTESAYRELDWATLATSFYQAFVLCFAIAEFVGPGGSGTPGSGAVDLVAGAIALASVGLFAFIGLSLLMGYSSFRRGLEQLGNEGRTIAIATRRHFLAFWIVFLVGIPLFVLPGFVFDIVWNVLPLVLIIALVLFLGHASWSPLRPASRKSLAVIVYSDVFVLLATCVGYIVLTWSSWPTMLSTGKLFVPFNPWTTIPSGTLNLVSLLLIHASFTRASLKPVPGENDT